MAEELFLPFYIFWIFVYIDVLFRKKNQNLKCCDDTPPPPPKMGYTDLNVMCKWAKLANYGLFHHKQTWGSKWSLLRQAVQQESEIPSWHPATVIEVGLIELVEREPLTHRGLGWGTDSPRGKREPLFQAGLEKKKKKTIESYKIIQAYKEGNNSYLFI